MSKPVIRLVRPLTVLAAACSLAALVGAETPSRPVEKTALSPIADAFATVDPDVREYDLHLVTLANPYFAGRLPGTRGMELATEYMETHFAQYGLEAPWNGSYRQSFEMGGEMKVTEAKLAALAGGHALTFEAGTDFNILGLGGTGDATAPVTVVGYGISGGPDGYTSFPDDLDLTGRIALMFRFEPMDEHGRSRWTDGGEGWSRQAGFNGKVRAVMDRGAAGVVIVNPPGADDPRASQLMAAGEGGRGRGDVPVAMMTPEAAERFLAAADPDGHTLMDLRKLADEGPGTVHLEGVMSLKGTLERDPVQAENVAGLLRGKGALADELIVVGAHLDHLGMGYFGSRSGPGTLHPGADDNASGSAGILLFSRLLADSYRALPDDAEARSVLFMGFSAEESGLNGSRAYVQNPLWPIEQHAFMINFDMIGRIKDGRLSVSGMETGEGVREYLQPFFEQTPLTVVQPDRMMGASDHSSFSRAGVPVLFGIIADFHDDYHTPRDEAWKINRVGATQTIRLFHDIALDMARRPDRFAFATPSARDGGGAPTIAAGNASAVSGLKVRFGIMPGTYDENEPGIPISAVTEGGSAALAGVQAGDRLLRWDGIKIGGVREWMEMLGKHNPGDTVKIGVVRDGEEITLDVTLQAREEG